jgi:hypothetical protein
VIYEKGTLAKVKCHPIVWRYINMNIKIYERFENLNFLYVRIKAQTISNIGKFSATQVALSKGLIHKIINSNA